MGTVSKNTTSSTTTTEKRTSTKTSKPAAPKSTAPAKKPAAPAKPKPANDQFRADDAKRDAKGNAGGGAEAANGARALVGGLNDSFKKTPAAKAPDAKPELGNAQFRQEVEQSRQGAQQRQTQVDARASELQQQEAATRQKITDAQQRLQGTPEGPDRQPVSKEIAKLKKELKPLPGKINDTLRQGRDAQNVLNNAQRLKPAESLPISKTEPWFDKTLGPQEAASSQRTHANNHAAEVGATSEADYVKKAQQFAEKPPKGAVQLGDQHSPTRVVYDPQSRHIGVYNKGANGYSPITYHQLNPQSPEFPRGHTAGNNTQALLESQLHGVPNKATPLPDAPQAPVTEPAAAKPGVTGRLVNGGLGLAGAGLGGYQAYNGLNTLANAKNADQVVAGTADTVGGALNSGSGVAALRGAGAVASRLGGAGAIVGGAADLYRGFQTGDREAMALGGIKAAAGAAMFVPGVGTAIGGGVLLATAAYENREWLAKQVGNGWSAVSNWWNNR